VNRGLALDYGIVVVQHQARVFQHGGHLLLFALL
jgi:hypothetical protein